MAHESYRDDVYYKESGIVPILSLPVMMLTGIAVAALVSPVIAALTLFFLGCVGFGFIFGAAFFVPGIHGAFVSCSVAGAADLCSVRNRRVVKGVCLVATFVAFYFFFHAQVWFWTGASLNRFFPLLHPEVLLDETLVGFGQCTTVGMWIIVFFLLVVFALYLLGCFAVFREYPFEPYCEQCYSRCGLHPTTITFLSMDFYAFENGDFGTLVPFEPDETTVYFCRAKIYKCLRCDESIYLRVWFVRRALKPNKKWAEEEKLVMNLLRVPSSLIAVFDAANAGNAK